jgi:hypothetical protein
MDRSNTIERIGSNIVRIAAVSQRKYLTKTHSAGTPKFGVGCLPKTRDNRGMESKAADKPVPLQITAMWSDERLILRETQRAVTPFGGIAVSFPGQNRLRGSSSAAHASSLPSPNHIDPTFTFTAFLVSISPGSLATRTPYEREESPSVPRGAFSPERMAVTTA